MQPADIAVTLRRRSPWEAADLGLAMLRHWWRPVYAAHALVFLPLAAALISIGWALGALWLAVLMIWWLEPLYDRMVLHVLSRAVFGQTLGVRAVLAAAREWLATGLVASLTWERFDLARSFNLPVRQLEGSRGSAARARRAVLGRRARGNAVWLTIVWLHFEAALVWSAGALGALLLPAQLERARGAGDPFFGGFFDAVQAVSAIDASVYAAVIFFLEPFYVAAGFGLYLNRRTLLEGWDIEVALRRLADRRAPALIAIVALLFLAAPAPAEAQQKNPKQEIAEVLKAPEFGHYRETTRWAPRDPAKPRTESESSWDLRGIGYALARAAEVLLWVLVVAAIAYALWRARQLVSAEPTASAEAYRAPAALFGMELAPETLPGDVPQGALALAHEGKTREALSLLYRGALSELVHKRGVELLPSHTEVEALELAAMPYFRALVEAWSACAYGRRLPEGAEVERLALDYRLAFS